jgi:ammonium transporter, Amt family
MNSHRLFSLLTAAALLSWAGTGTSLSAEDTPAAAPAPAVAPAEPAPSRAAATSPGTPSPTLEQRVRILEAYLTNGDPTIPLKTGPNDKHGNPTIPDGLLANTPTATSSGPGHNAWMMISAALVLFMTLPGLALSYGGLVCRKNALSICAQCLGCAGMVTVLWWAFGYSLVFGRNFENASYGAFLGGTEHFFFHGVTSAPNPAYSPWVSQNILACYFLMFAILTPALIVGAIAERMKYSAVMLFIALWMFLVFFPVTHMVWGVSGLMSGVLNAEASIHAIDFAGGYVVHMTSGWSALILCLILGKRRGYGREKMAPHSMVLCMVGTAMLWIGWYGFNAGSAEAADGVAANAFTTTTLAAGTAGFVWGLIELIHKGHASVLGFCSGIMAGLVTVAPACGFVSSTSAVAIGVLGAAVPYIFIVFVKAALRYDDALDAFGVHAIGGTLGVIITGIAAVPARLADGTINPEAVNPKLAAHVDAVIHQGTLIFEQLKAAGLTLVISVVGTFVLAVILKIILGLRPTEEEESVGLDISDHQEEGYDL